jgi:hypothetical protein
MRPEWTYFPQCGKRPQRLFFRRLIPYLLKNNALKKITRHFRACHAQDCPAMQRLSSQARRNWFRMVESNSYAMFTLDNLDTAMRQNPIETRRSLC